MSEFERLLDETLAVGMGDEYFQPWSKGLEVAHAALLAYHERVAQERDLHVALSESLKMALRMPGTGNYVEWARECRDAIDALSERDARIAELEPDAERYRWLQTAGMFRCDADMSGRHHWMGLGRNIGRGHSLDEAIDAARKAKEEP